MKPKPETIHGLAHVGTFPTNAPDVLGFELRDEKGRHLAAAINAWGLADIVEQCLRISCEPMFAAATNMKAGDAPPTIHADGSRLELRSGRSPKEVAATMTVGCQRVVVFLPLEEVLRSTHALIQSIEPDTSAGPH